MRKEVHLILGLLVILMCSGGVYGAIYAHAGPNYNWSDNPSADSSGGWWYYKMLVAPGTPSEAMSLMDPYSWNQNSTTVYGYARGYWQGEATAPWIYKYDAVNLAALPWNSGTADGDAYSEEQVVLVWESGVTGAIKLNGEFSYLGDEQAAVAIVWTDGNTQQDLLTETLLTPGDPNETFGINTTVSAGNEIWFVIGTDIKLYDDIDNETLISVTVIPEPTMLSLIGVCSLMLIRRKNRREALRAFRENVR